MATRNDEPDQDAATQQMHLSDVRPSLITGIVLAVGTWQECIQKARRMSTSPMSESHHMCTTFGVL